MHCVLEQAGYSIFWISFKGSSHQCIKILWNIEKTLARDSKQKARECSGHSVASKQRMTSFCWWHWEPYWRIENLVGSSSITLCTALISHLLDYHLLLNFVPWFWRKKFWQRWRTEKRHSSMAVFTASFLSMKKEKKNLLPVRWMSK